MRTPFASIAPHARAQSPARRAARLLAALVVLAGSGCVWGTHARRLEAGEPLALEAMTVRAPEGTDWHVSRAVDADSRELVLERRSGIGWDRRLVVVELDRVPAPSREHLRAISSGSARRNLGEDAAEVTELPPVADPRFGSGAVEVLLRAEAKDPRSELLEARAAAAAALAFAEPGAPGRACVVSYEERGGAGRTPDELREAWREVLAGVELGPPSASLRARATRAGAFAKDFHADLVRRSLTLPKGGFRATFARESWLASGGAGGGWGLSVGLTDRLELSTPAFVERSFGDPAALERPELALGLGLTRYEHDVARGDVWGGGISARVRRRMGARWAWRAGIVVEASRESALGLTRVDVTSTAGLVWARRGLLTLGLEGGHASDDPWAPEREGGRRLAWIGGRSTPLATLHLPPFDLGLSGAAAWDGEGFGLLGGVVVGLTL